MAAPQHLEALLTASSPILGPIATDLGSKRRLTPRVLFRGPSLRLDFAERSDVSDVLARASEQICSLAEYASAVEALRAAREAPPEVLHRFLSDVLREFMWSTESSAHLLSSLDLAAAAHNAWVSDTVEATRTSLVAGIHPDSALPCLPPDIDLTLASDDFRNDFWNDPRLLSFVPGPNAISAISVSHCLRVRHPVPAGDVFGYLHTFGQRTERNVISALRLCLGAPLGLVATKIAFFPLPQACTGVTLVDPRPETFVRGVPADAKLNQDHATRIRDVFDILQSDIPAGFDLALRRFNFSFERQEPEDALLDLAIALEATILHGVDTELSFRLKLLGAALLPSEPQVADQLATFYKLRSKVAHGSASLQKELKKQRPAEYILSARHLVSRLLLAYLALLKEGRSMDQIKVFLEQRLLDGLAKEAT